VRKIRLGKFSEEEFLFCLRHGLDYKAFVFAEEEETSTGATSLACFENIAAVYSRV